MTEARPTRTARTTPSRYRLRSLVALGALGAALIAGAMAAAELDQRTTRVADRTGPVLVATQELFSSLAEADAAATAVHLSGRDEDRDQRRSYELALDRANRQIGTVASLIGRDRRTNEALEGIATKLTRYAGFVEAARTSNRGGAPSDANASLAAALELMRVGIGEDIAQLTAITQERVDRDFDRPAVVVMVALAALAASLAALLSLQWFMAKRARRLINPALFLATLLVIGALAWLFLAERNQRRDLDEASSDAYEAIALTSRVQTIAYRAKADESLTLIGAGAGRFEVFERSANELASEPITPEAIALARQGQVRGAGWLADAVRQADSRGERAAAAEMLERWQRYRETNQRIQDAASRGQRVPATAIALESGNRAFTGFNLAVESLLLDNKEQFTAGLSAARDRLRWTRGGMIVLPALAAALMLRGIQRRINEYR